MRIALLSYEFPTETGFGGIGTYAWYQARALAQLGHEVRVIAGRLEPGISHEEVDGVKVTRVLDPGHWNPAVVGLREAELGWASNRLQTAAGAFIALRAAMEHEDFDIVEYPECGADGMIVSTMLPVTTSVRFHSPAPLIMGDYGADERDTETTTFFEQIAINQADVRIASSHFLAAEVIKRLRVPPPVHVVRNGIDLELFDKEQGIDVVERFGLPKDAVTILFSSRLEPRKGVHMLAEIGREILGRYPNVHFVIAGDDLYDWVKYGIGPDLTARGFGDRFHALGRVTLQEVRSLLRYVDIHLLPTRWENAPYACIEAMASSRAVLSSDSTGMPELIHDGINGLTARTEDPQSFIAQLERLIEDRDLRERLGSNARRSVEEDHSAKATAIHTVDIWRRAIAG
jgi:glycosyltransferase involved in cell wall biosynthesis